MSSVYFYKDEINQIDAYFTNSEKILEYFEYFKKLIKNGGKRILYIHGVGGMGKSTLILKLSKIASDSHCPVAIASGDDVNSLPDIFLQWISGLKEHGLRFRSFDKALKKYKKLQADKQKGFSGIGKTAVSVGGEVLASQIPIAGPLIAPVFGKGIGLGIDWAKDMLSAGDTDLKLFPSDELTTHFLEDLQGYTQQRIFLMLDAFEKLPIFQNWVVSLLRRMPDNVVVTIASQNPPEWERAWKEWVLNTEELRLQPLEDEDMKTLIHRYCSHIGIEAPDDQQVSEIVRFSRGLPLAGITAVNLSHQFGDIDILTIETQAISDILDRLFENVPKKMRNLIELASIPRWFTQSTLRALSDGQCEDSDYRDLMNLPFIKPKKSVVGGSTFQETMRDLIIEYIRIHDLERFQKLHNNALTYYGKQLQPTNQIDQNFLEYLYHQTNLNEDPGIELFSRRANELIANRSMDEFRTLLNDVGTYTLQKDQSLKWLSYYQIQLDYLESRIPQAEKEFQALLTKQVDNKLRAYILVDLAKIQYKWERRKTVNLEGIAEDLEQSLSLVEVDQKTFEALIILYRIKQQLGYTEEAESLYARAIQYCDNQNNHNNKISLITQKVSHLSNMGNLIKMLDYYHQGEGMLKELPKNSYPIESFLTNSSYGLILIGKYHQAEKALYTALGICKQNKYENNTICRRLALALTMQNKLETARNNIQLSLDKCKSLGSGYEVSLAYALGISAHIDIREGHWENAQEQLSAGLNILEKHNVQICIPEVHVWLGNNYETQQNFDDSIVSYNTAIEKNKGIERELGKENVRNYHTCQALLGLSRIFYKSGRLDLFRPTLEKLIPLATSFEYNDILAHIKLLQGHSCLDNNDEGMNEQAIKCYFDAMILALRFNRFCLDNILGDETFTLITPIIQNCLNNGLMKNHILSSLQDKWLDGKNSLPSDSNVSISDIPKGMSLIDAERLARKNEPGNSESQLSVCSRINRALS